MGSRTTAILLSLLLVPLLAGIAHGRARQKVKPRLLLTVEGVESASPAPRVLARLKVALGKALHEHPLVITSLGPKKLTGWRLAWELRRRRLRWFGVVARLESLSHQVVTRGGERYLLAVAEVSLRGRRRERARKGTFAVKGRGRSETRVSVVLQGEVLSARHQAATAALRKAVDLAVARLVTRRRRRLRRAPVN